MNIPHKPVLIKEVLEILMPIENGIFIDATFGAGGYTRAILEKGAAKIFSIDQDPEAQKYSTQLKKEFSSKFSFINANFINLKSLLHEKKLQKADGIVFDLGVSSMQLDEGERGFSFNKLGTLDMRMSREGLSAKDFINEASEEDLANIIYKYGDEKYSRRIAKSIVLKRKENTITNTIELANIVRGVLPNKGKEKIDPATRTFQAIRIYVNDELFILEKTLSEIAALLKPKGKLVIVSFHSLEDKIVKDFLKDNSAPKVAISKYKNTNNNLNYKFEILNKKIILPSAEEIKSNIRSRSAKLRAAIRTDFIGD